MEKQGVAQKKIEIAYFSPMPAPRLRLDHLPAHLRAAFAAGYASSRKPTRAPRGPSPLVISLLDQIRLHGLPEPSRHALAPAGELVFAPPRRWRFDLAWPDRMLAVEVDGGVWTQGRHTRGAGFIEDCVKTNRAVVLGWRVLRFPGPHVKDGTAVRTLREALANDGESGLTS